MHRITASLSVTAFALCASCAAPPPSTVTGTVAQASFAEPVTHISARSSAGVVTVAAVDAQGDFSIALEEGSAYRFFLSPDGTGTPLVVRTEGDRLETELFVRSAGAEVDIGKVRFWGGARDTRSRSVGLSSPLPEAGAACVEGFFEGTAQPCASGVAKQVCGGGDHHGGCPGMMGGDHHPGAGDLGDLGDLGDHLPAEPTVGDPATDASPTQPTAVPEKSLPPSIGCGDGGGHHHHHHH